MPALTSTPPTARPDGAETPGRRAVGVALMLTGGASNQIGASVAALAFPVLGPVGVVAVRQWVGAVVLIAAGRPRVRSFTQAQWWPVLGLAASFGCMNLALYSAVSRIGLGLAVTLEFLGPLTVALLTSRRRLDLLCALSAAGAVAVLLRPEASTDAVGIGLGLLAACCWAAYILLNRTVGRRLHGIEGTAAAAAASGLAFVPIGIVALRGTSVTTVAVACAVVAGLLSSAVPYLADLLALRRVPTNVFGVAMSAHPVFASIAGLVVLGQSLDTITWVSVGVIVTANAIAVSTAGRSRSAALPAQAAAPT